jgi:hypothetical protein
MDQPAFLLSLTVKPDIDLDRGHFPASLPWLPSLDVRFEGPVTFFVGENGSGKSTLHARPAPQTRRRARRRGGPVRRQVSALLPPGAPKEFSSGLPKSSDRRVPDERMGQGRT